MFLKMLTSMGGPTISLTYGDEIPFDDEFPFGDAETRRFIDAGTAELIGSADQVAAWLEANPSAVPVDADSTQAAVEAQLPVEAVSAADALLAPDTPPAPAPNEIPAAAAAAATASAAAPKAAAKTAAKKG
ncbi:hypothetical protein [Sphingopyxis sp.]|uniref:hypothetical protein n=1 Tax=Sphingopyxis sp. TaxID=1908224 RepID=UPI003F6E9EB9